MEMLELTAQKSARCLATMNKEDIKVFLFFKCEYRLFYATYMEECLQCSTVLKAMGLKLKKHRALAVCNYILKDRCQTGL